VVASNEVPAQHPHDVARQLSEAIDLEVVNDVASLMDGGVAR
jgi:hypothetical protein